MTEEESEILKRIEKIENNIKRIEELNRLGYLEKIHLTVLIMLIGFAISLIFFSWEKSEIVTILCIGIILFLAIILIDHLYGIYKNDLEYRIESFGSDIFFIFIIVILLTSSTIDLILRNYISELLVFLSVGLICFCIGILFPYPNIRKNITSKIYNQLRIIKTEIDLKKTITNEKSEVKQQLDKLFMKILIIGSILPLILHYIFMKIGVKQSIFLVYFSGILLIFSSSFYIIGRIYMGNQN